LRRIFALTGREEVRSGGGDLMKVPPELLKIAGDNADMPFESIRYISRQNAMSFSPGVTQRITNTGSGDLVFLCVCTPPFQPATYVRHE
jgi:hypothetical protein